MLGTTCMYDNFLDDILHIIDIKIQIHKNVHCKLSCILLKRKVCLSIYSLQYQQDTSIPAAEFGMKAA
jgi:hypothetical protein